ncbi:thiamine pyrophosphate-binding protein [Conexibacter woesei]|uniref:Thiamine pyrophosphate protein TPP binding domain protein n=1 Tax=Conexibacter woesei (strain DSM 14684 / CCUG 47730 / CIP 108061 / JCM 11494 / NBRC 100937 / ID131577) TaxID=469383 RepID=D3F5K6_CONWI|nr:thiamine pyrophosphate-binding protein [Conexibacter woesei]ADB50673.1 thiamine pyrophosphate protein TPP binding domain protein [Conexibacter woesei DSM 14684]
MSAPASSGGEAASQPAPPPASSGGEALVQALEQLGVTCAFGLPGVHNLPAWAALARSPIRLVGVRHEQTAAYAADGYARASGRLGVALTTTGPGAANALGATGEAWASHSPVLVIATDIPTTLRRAGAYRGVLHETRDQAAMFEPVVKRTYVCHAADHIAPLVQAAAAHALHAPSGPVYVQIPTDLLSAPVGRALAPPAPAPPRAPADPAALRRAVELLDDAERVLIWAGGGAVAAGAGSALALLAERLAAPVIETYGGRALLGGHPCAVGLPPHLPHAGELWDRADVVLAVGSDFDGMTTQNWLQPQPRCLIAVNVDPVGAAENYPPDVALIGDARTTCEALAAAVSAAPPAAVDALAADLASRRAAADAFVAADEPQAAELLGTLAAVLDEDDVVVADMCIPGYWTAALHRFAQPRKLAYPVGWGTLGFAFPASIGTALAGAGRALCVCGDGGFLFAAGELATLAQERIPLTLLIVDDGAYGMLRYDQRHAGQEVFGVELESPDFVAWARACGIAATAVDGVGAPLADALRSALADPSPTVVVARASLDPPPTTSPRWYRRAAVPPPTA